MDNKSITTIAKGGILSAAFSFIFFISPAIGIITNFLSLAPLFYVGLKLKNIQAFLLAALIPFISLSLFINIQSGITFALSNLSASLFLLMLHLLKIGKLKERSKAGIIHKFSQFFLMYVSIIFAYIYISKINVLDIFGASEHLINIFKAQGKNPSTILEFLPGISCFVLMAMNWINYSIAYVMFLKNVKKPEKYNFSKAIPPYWDIVMVGSLWLYLGQKLVLNSQLISIFSKTIFCISLFPLLMEGLDILKLIAKHYKFPAFAYFIMLFFGFTLVWPLCFVVALGLIEPWYGLRKKYIDR